MAPTATPKKAPKNWSTTPGIYHSLPETDYHNDSRAVSKSQLDMVNRSPAHWQYGIANPKQPTAAMELGSMVHALVLEPERFNERWIVPPKIDKRTKIGKAQWAEWVKTMKPGQTCVEQDKVDTAKNMAAGVWANDDAAWILKDSIREVTVVWRDNKAFREQLIGAMGIEGVLDPEPTGMHCKIRIDSWRPADGMWIDLKTTADASPDHWPRMVHNFRYHVQGAFYTDGGMSHGIDPKHFGFIVVENTPPFVCQVYRLHDAAIDLGRVQYTRNMHALKIAKSSGHYRGYADSTLDVDLPVWAYNAETI